LSRRARGLGWCIRAGSQLHDLGFERLGAQQATRDVREDQPDVACAKRERDSGVGALLQGGGEFLAVIDELAHQVEEAPEPAGFVLAEGSGVWYDRDGGRGGHERNKNRSGGARQGIYSGCRGQPHDQYRRPGGGHC
jgi:hypothetical protein